jgi:hypothetical protein
VQTTVVLATIEGGLAFALFGALTLLVLVGIAYVLTHGEGAGESPYERIGAGGLTREEDFDAPAPARGSLAEDSAAHAATPAGAAEREREIRQLLQARSERLVRGGGEPLDVEAELARLLEDDHARPGHAGAGAGAARGAPSAELLAEVRQLVLARNERRVRQGREPLDVDAEVARTLAELEPRAGRANAR